MPAKHKVHVAEPAEDQLPEPHETQYMDEGLFDNGLLVPAGQLLQATEKGVDQVPGGQAGQAEYCIFELGLAVPP